MKHYILKKDNVVEVTFDVWCTWMESSCANRVLAKTRIGHIEVSTVFLGLDHGFEETGAPIIFESMIFEDTSIKVLGRTLKQVELELDYDEGSDPIVTQQRYCTHAEALVGHATMVADVKKLLHAAGIAAEEYAVQLTKIKEDTDNGS